ncbi:MAG: ribosome silencing factor [Coriobacteriales bacterium]
MTPKDYALIAARAADSKKGSDIVIQHVSELLVITDYFVIVTGANDRQVAAIADEVEEQLLKEAHIKPIGREGMDDRKWILLDFGELVVHVLQPAERDFYRIETLWNDAPLVDLAEAGIEAPILSTRPVDEMADEESIPDSSNRERGENDTEVLG